MKDQIIINQTCKQGGLFTNMLNFIDSFSFDVRLAAFLAIALCVLIPLVIWTVKKDYSEPLVTFEPETIVPKQELTTTDYTMVLDSMMLFGIITLEQYNEYMITGLPYFQGE